MPLKGVPSHNANFSKDAPFLGTWVSRGRTAVLALLIALIIHRSAWNRNSRKFGYKILHTPTPVGPVAPLLAPRQGPGAMHLATRLDRYAPCCMRLWRWLVLLLVHISIGTAHGPAHANGLGFLVCKGEIFQVLALPYVLLPTPVEDPYGAQSVLNILDLQSGAIYACLHPHQRYNALPLFFLAQVSHARLPLLSAPENPTPPRPPCTLLRVSRTG